MACAIGSEDLVSYLFDQGVEVNLKSKPDSNSSKAYAVPKISPLHLAVYSNNIELVHIIAPKIEINNQDQVCNCDFMLA